MRVKEDSVAFITLEPIDKNGNAYTPSTVRWRLDNGPDGAQITDWASVASADISTSMEITIPATSNAIIDDNLDFEEKVFTYQFDQGTDEQHTDEQRYDVENLSGV